MTQTYDELKNRLATIHDLRMAGRQSWAGTSTRRCRRAARSCAREQLATLDGFTHELFIDEEIGRLLDELRDYEESARLRLRRGEPDPRRAARLREGEAGAAELRAEMTRDRRARAAGLDRGAREVGLRDLPAPSEAERRAHAPLHRLLRGLRRSATTSLLDDFERGHDDAPRCARSSTSSARARAADRADRRERRRASTTRRCTATSRSSSSARSCARGARAAGLRPRELAARPDGAPVRDRASGTGDMRLTTRYDRDDLAVGAVRSDPRVRPRALRAGRRPGARAHAALRR